jgi:hypothetical protein
VLPRTQELRCSSVGPAFAREEILVTRRRPSKQIDPFSETPVVLVVDDDPSLREALVDRI